MGSKLKSENYFTIKIFINNVYLQENKDGFKEAIKEKLPELLDEEKEDIVISIIKHFENPEPVISSPPKGGRRYGGKFRRYSSSYKDNRKSLSDKENDHHSRSPTPSDHNNGLKTEELKCEITKNENGAK